MTRRHFPGSQFVSGDWINGFGLKIETEDGHTYHACYVFGEHQQGPPGTAHGGAIATLLDELMTAAVYEYAQVPTYTVNLNVNYRAPVLLLTDIMMRARVERIEGRKLFATAEMTGISGTVMADAAGIFVMVPPPES